MKEELILSQRLKELRIEKKMNQKTIAKELPSYMCKEKAISTSAMCSWEKGVKRPSYEALMAFADYYGVTTDYLLGKSNMKKSIHDNPVLNRENNFVRITEEQLQKSYHAKPVYLVFDHDMSNGKWAIFNKDKNIFCCADCEISNNQDIEHYVDSLKTLQDLSTGKTNLTLDEAKKCDQVWIEYDNPSSELRTRYSGWYYISIPNSLFIASNGFALPFDSIDVVYHVYANRPE